MISRIHWAVVAVVWLGASACDPSSEVAQAVRDGGVADAGGEERKPTLPAGDDFRPPSLGGSGRSAPEPQDAGRPSAPRDTGIDAGRSDPAPPPSAAGSGGQGAAGAPVPAMSDAGSAPEFEDDAGSQEPPVCTSVECACERICERGAAEQCLDEPPLEDCLTFCAHAVPGCEVQHLALLTCQREAGDDRYVCDEDLWSFVVLGCEIEEAALGACRTQ